MALQAKVSPVVTIDIIAFMDYNTPAMRVPSVPPHRSAVKSIIGGAVVAFTTRIAHVPSPKSIGGKERLYTTFGMQAVFKIQNFALLPNVPATFLCRG